MGRKATENMWHYPSPVFLISSYQEEKTPRLDFIILLIVLWLLGERTALVPGNNSFVQLKGWQCCGAGNALMILESVLIFNLLLLLQLPAIVCAERQLFLWSQRIAAPLIGINFGWRVMEMAFAKMRKAVLHGVEVGQKTARAFQSGSWFLPV